MGIKGGKEEIESLWYGKNESIKQKRVGANDRRAT